MRHIFHSPERAVSGNRNNIALSGLGIHNPITTQGSGFAFTLGCGYIAAPRLFVAPMLATKQHAAAARRDSEKEQLQRKCDYIDGEIDLLVYELYRLTAEEIKIVVGS